MQNDIYECYDEVEPRSTPKPATKFDFRPVPMVPEVSLIMDKPQESRRMNDSTVNKMPELRSNTPQNTKYGGSESYAAWKEKQFPRQTNKISPSRLHQIYSSTQNSSSLQDLRSFKHPVRSCNSLDCKDYNCANLSSGDESPRRYNLSKRSHFETPNKYKLSHAVSSSEIDRHVNNSRNYASSRSRSREERPSPNDKKHRVDHLHAIEAYDIKHKPRIHRSSSCSNADSYAHHRSLPMESRIEYDHHSKHSRSLQPAHQSPERSHNHSGCCSSGRSSTETETIKNLLQIITSQNEQIKNLQKQVERLLKLHEQTLKERNSCTCQQSNEVVHQNAQIGDQSQNAHLYNQSQNAQLYNQSRNTNVPIVHNNMIKESERCYTDVNLQDEKARQAFLEQKVSIGVMTSFELKVQNNPSIKDNELKLKNAQEKIMQTVDTSRNSTKNVVNDTTSEMIRKKTNYFTHTPLENISEGSEGHSLRHDSTRQSIEAMQDCIEVQNTNNYYNQNYQQNENVQTDLDFKKSVNGYNQNFKPATNLDYETKQQMYRIPNQDAQERRPSNEYQNHQYRISTPYENQRSSPFENARSSPHENRRSSPHEHVRSSPHENVRSSPLEKASSTPFENARSAPYENARSAPFENTRSSPFENARSSPHENFKKKTDEYITEPLTADIVKMKNHKGADNLADDCLSLSGSELDVGDLSPPSPEPSIHLDIQEYSSEGGSLPPQQNGVGWTIYNNVLQQVNEILQNSSPMNESPEDESPIGMQNNQRQERDNNVIMDTVKAATLEQLNKLGISFSDNIDEREPNYNKKVMFDAYYTRQGPETHLTAAGGNFETNTSMHMKALAMKYLNDEQLADMAMQKQQPGIHKQGPGNTNMSFATMHYLQRYHLLPTNSSPMKAPRGEYREQPVPVISERFAMRAVETRDQSPQRYFPVTGSSKASYPSKILDISTLKRQPKLL